MKRNAWKRFGAVLLSGAMVLTTPAMGVLAEEVAVAAAEETAAVEVAAEEEAEELDVTEEADVEEVVTETALTEEAVEEVQENLVEEAASEEEQIIENEVIFDEVDLAEMEAVDSDAELGDINVWDETLMPGSGFEVAKYYTVYQWDEENEEDIAVEAVVTAAEVIVLEGDGDIITVTEEEDCWMIRGNSVGKAKITLTYEAVDGGYASRTTEFTVDVVDVLYNLDLSTSTGNQNVLPGQSLEIETRVSKETADEWIDNFENYKVEFELLYDDAECFTYEDSDKSIVLTAKEVGSARLVAKLIVDGETVDEVSMVVWVDESIYRIGFQGYEAVETLELLVYQGQSVVLSPELLWYDAENSEGTVLTENVRISWECWDTNSVEIKDANGIVLDPENNTTGLAPFTLTRIGEDGWVELRADRIYTEEDEEGNVFTCYDQVDTANVSLYSDWIDINFKGLTDEYSTVMFDDQTAVFEADTTEFPESGWTMEYKLGYWDNDSESIAFYENVPEGTLTVEGARVTVDGARLSTFLKSIYQSGVSVYGILKIGDVKISDNNSFWINVQESQCEYISLFDDQSEQLAGVVWEFEDKKMSCYIRNADYPDGETVKLDIMEMTSSNSSVLEVIEEDNLFRVVAVGEGTATLTVKLDGVNEEETLTRTVTIDDVVYEAWCLTGIFVYGQSKKLEHEVLKVTYDKEEGVYSHQLLTDGYTVSYSNYEENGFTIDSNGVLTAGNTYGEYPVTITYTITTEDGSTRSFVKNDTFTVTPSWSVPQTEKYTYIVNPGDTLTIGDLNASYIDYTPEYPDGMENTAADFVFAETDAAYVTITDGGKTLKVRSDLEELPVTCIVKVAISVDGLSQGSTSIELLIEKEHTHVWSDYAVTKAATCIAAGSKTAKCTVSGCTETKTEVIPATGHNMVNGKVISEATVLKEKQQQLVCKNGCGHTETVSVKGTKLTPTITLTESSIVLQVKKSTTAFTISGLAKGDSIKSIELAKGGDVYVSLTNKNLSKGTMKLTGKKAGSTKLIITLASGTKEVPIKVQKGAVKTTKLTDTNTRVTLAKKGAKLKVTPSRVPFTSADKIKYTVKNKKVAKVASNGTITAVAPGTTTVTAKAGKGKITYNVVVKGITLSKTSVTVKKGKTATLKVTKCGISGTPTFKSSNTAVATVDANGKVTGIKKGSATITVKLNGYTAKCKIKVKK